MTAATGVRALLADGRIVVISPVGPADTDAVLSLHARLSEVDACGMVHGLRSSAALFAGDHPLPTEGLVDVLRGENPCAPETS